MLIIRVYEGFTSRQASIAFIQLNNAILPIRNGFVPDQESHTEAEF